jgi:hypothetical protein
MEILPRHLWKIEPVIREGVATGEFEVSMWAHNNYRQFALVAAPVPMDTPQPWAGRPMRPEEIADVMGRWTYACAVKDLPAAH